MAIVEVSKIINIDEEWISENINFDDFQDAIASGSNKFVILKTVDNTPNSELAKMGNFLEALGYSLTDLDNLGVVILDEFGSFRFFSYPIVVKREGAAFLQIGSHYQNGDVEQKALEIPLVFNGEWFLMGKHKPVPVQLHIKTINDKCIYQLLIQEKRDNSLPNRYYIDILMDRDINLDTEQIDQAWSDGTFVNIIKERNRQGSAINMSSCFDQAFQSNTFPKSGVILALDFVKEQQGDYGISTYWKITETIGDCMTTDWQKNIVPLADATLLSASAATTLTKFYTSNLSAKFDTVFIHVYAPNPGGLGRYPLHQANVDPKRLLSVVRSFGAKAKDVIATLETLKKPKLASVVSETEARASIEPESIDNIPF